MSGGATGKGSAPAATALPRRGAERGCAERRGSEDRPRHLPAPAAEARPPAPPQLPASPGPPPPAARPRPAESTAPGGGPRQARRPRSASGRPVRGVSRWGGSCGGAGRGLRRLRGARGQGGRRPGLPPPGPRFLERRCLPSAARPGPGLCGRRPRAAAPASLSGATGLPTGSRTSVPPALLSFGCVVGGEGEPRRRSRARCLSLSPLAAERGASVRPGVPGPGLSLCARLPPGGRCAPGRERAICAWRVAAVWVLQAHLQGLKFFRGQRGCLYTN